MGILTLARSITVEPVVFLFMWSSFQQFPTNQALIYSKVCAIEFNNDTICDNLYAKQYKSQDSLVQSEASKWIMYNNIASTVPSIFTVTFFLGPYGDKIGRKIPLILPIIGCLLFNVANLINSHFMLAPMWWLLFGNVINGLTGGYIAVMMAAYSYIGHISSIEFRTFRVGVIESIIFLAGTLGVFISGAMLDNTSYDFVYCFIICLLLIALIYSLLRLENLKPEYGNNAKTPLTKTLFDSVYTMYGCIRRSRASHTRLRIILLVAVLVILQLCTTGESDIMYLFVKLPVFDWSTSTYGYFRGLENFTRGLAVLTILPLCTKKLQASDTTLILAGLLSKLIGLIILAFAATTWQMFLVPLVGVFQGFPSAAIRSTTSKMVNQNEQGNSFKILYFNLK
ncbi:hypothetical protein FSP39_019524 [Pinctada imbricata]|uniref:Proton-coupled folate transporter-like protein n=1 Tax=Pinctada imbricata TaxID=66713 RepID=A0AA89BQA0_PINIB|nr:hypothetical protein FSP39_019524 [Pinctada imbricata]